MPQSASPGEVKQITYPSGRVVQQNYDAIGRLCAIAQTSSGCSSNTNPYATGYAYNTAFELTGFNYGNGVAASFGYSADRLQMTSLSFMKGTSTLYNLNYFYKTDATYCPNAPGGDNGQISSITDSVDNGRSASYTYDALARLTAATTTGSTAYPQWGLSFTYDRYANRTAQSISAGCTMSCPTNSVAVSTTTNRITTSGYGYDAKGNMTNDGSNTLTYDAENHLLTSAGILGSGTYSYDGNGLRVKKVSGSTTTVYAFSGTKVIAEYVNGAAPTSPTREYIYSGGALLAKIEGTATQYYNADHLSTRLMTDSSGNKIGEQGHFPYGETWYLTNTTTKWEFTSYERDGESGNDYAMARYHVNRLGRFSLPDLLAGSTGNPQSLNMYVYVLDDPTNRWDPFGLTSCYTAFGTEVPCSDSNGPENQCNSDTCQMATACTADGSCTVQTAIIVNGGLDMSSGVNAGDPSPTQLPGFTQDPGGGGGGDDPLRGSKDPTKLPLCTSVFAKATLNALSPVSPSLASAGEPAAALASASIWNSALNYAASRPNYLGGQGLLYPLRSSVFRGLSALANEVAVAGPLISADLALLQGLAVETYQAYKGQCRAH
jgi:RHS repeat-associated protein